MTRKRLLAVVALTHLIAAAVGGGTLSLSVDQIIERNTEARGGVEKIKAIRTLIYSGGLYQEGDYTGSGDAFMAFERPYYRVVGNPERPDGYMEGYDGAAWEWLGDPGIVVRTVGAAAGATRRGADFEGPFIDYSAKGSRVVLGEPAEIAGRPAYRLVVTHRDGFVRQYFVDQESFLITAERRSAPIHAFGAPVTSETRIGDYRPVAGVLFAHSFVEREIATGELLNQMQWGKVEANRELPASWFSPPPFERSELQSFLEHLYAERTDGQAVLWSYHEFRRAHPEIDTREGVEVIGYQMLKMGEARQAVALLEVNARDYPQSSSSAFGLARAYETAGDRSRAHAEYKRALRLDAGNRRAERALAELLGREAPAVNPLSFLEPFVGNWRMDPDSDLVRDHPELADFVVFRFEWAEPRQKILRFFEGIPAGDYDRRVLENLVTFNPRSGEVVALGFQLEGGSLYESTFLPTADGYIREYKVTYPLDQEFGRDEDRERGWIRYRDRCRLIDPDRIHCFTEQMRSGEWTPWGRAEGYTVLRE